MNRIVLIVIAVVLMGFGAYRQFAVPAASAEDRARCEALVQEKYQGAPEMLSNCDDPGMIAMMDAQGANSSAEQAAQAIASANQADLSGDMLNWLLIGLGIGALIAAFRPKRA